MTKPSSVDAEKAADGYVELAFTLFLVLASVVFLWQSTLIADPPRNIVVGPRTFPTIVGWLMLAASLVLAWRQVRIVAPGILRGRRGAEMTVVPLEDDDDNAVSDWPAVWIMLAALVALFVLLEPLGFVAALTLFLFGLPTFFGPRRWLRNLVVALTFSLFFYYVFTEVLLVPLPNGILAGIF